MPILFTDRSRQAQGGRAKSRAMSRTSHILQDQSHPAGPVTSSRTSHIQQDQSHPANPVTSSKSSHIQQDSVTSFYVLTHHTTHACNSAYTLTCLQSYIAAISILNPEEPKETSTALMRFGSISTFNLVRKLQRTLSKVFPRS